MHEPLGHRGLVPQRGQVPAFGGQRLTEPPVGQQSAVGIGGIRHPVQQPGQQHRLHPSAPAALIDQRRHVFQRGLRSLVAQRGQPAPAASNVMPWAISNPVGPIDSSSG